MENNETFRETAVGSQGTINPIYGLIGEIHSVLDLLEKRADIILRPESPVGISADSKLANAPAPIEVELRGILNHARKILNRI